jgi:hypothetical protein
MPMTLDEAAKELRMSERWLRGWLSDNPVDANGVPFYIPMGRRKEFEPSDIERIRTRIRELEQCRLNFTAAKEAPSGITAEQLGRLAQGKDFVARRGPPTKAQPRAKLPTSKAGTGKVITMDQVRS